MPRSTSSPAARTSSPWLWPTDSSPCSSASGSRRPSRAGSRYPSAATTESAPVHLARHLFGLPVVVTHQAHVGRVVDGPAEVHVAEHLHALDAGQAHVVMANVHADHD